MATAMALGEAAGTMAAIAAEAPGNTASLDVKTITDRLRAQDAAISVEDCYRLSGREPSAVVGG